MFARLFQFTIDPAQWNAVEQLADTSHEAMRASQGFQSVTFFGDPEAGECGSLSLWDTREDLESFVTASTPRMQEAAAGLFKGPPKIATLDVYQPKS